MLAQLASRPNWIVLSFALLIGGVAALKPVQAGQATLNGGVISVASKYGFEDTVQRLKTDIAAKGITFFAEIDQARLGAAAGLTIKPSTLLVFGNPPLGIQFLTSNPVSGLDWPVRLLVYEDQNGQVRAAYTKFDWIARRHGIRDRKAQFKMASEVIVSITSAVAQR